MPYSNGKIVNWKVKITGIKSLLTDDDSVEIAQKVGKEIYKIISVKRYEKYFKDYEFEINEPLKAFNNIEECDHLNFLLDLLYDYCDEHLIWID